MLTGQQFDQSISTAPFSIRHSPSFSLEIGVNDPSQVEQAVTVLNGFKEMAKGFVPEVAQAMKMGLDLQFRNENGRFFFDLVVGGLLGGVIQETASKVNFQLLNYAGLADFHISSQASPLHALTNNLEQLVRSACFTEIVAGGEVVNTRTVLKIVQLIVGALKGSDGKHSKNLNTVIGFINAFQHLGFEIKFNPRSLFDAIRDSINARSSQNDKFGVLSGKFTENQGMLNAFVEQGKMMSMMIADYAPMLKNLNLDKIYVHLNFPVVRTSFQLHVHLNGITDFINQNFLG